MNQTIEQAWFINLSDASTLTTKTATRRGACVIIVKPPGQRRRHFWVLVPIGFRHRMMNLILTEDEPNPSDFLLKSADVEGSFRQTH